LPGLPPPLKLERFRFFSGSTFVEVSIVPTFKLIKQMREIQFRFRAAKICLNKTLIYLTETLFCFNKT
jgi:hypothetical protein